VYDPTNDEFVVITRNQIIATIIVAILGVALLIGALITPWVNGQPLLLTRDNLQVKTYLDQFGQRLTAMEKEHAELTKILTTNQSNLFNLAERGRTSLSNLEALARDVERTRVPAGLAGPDTALRGALAAELNFTDKVLEYVGKADEQSRTDALAAGEDAKAKIAIARGQQGVR
jgi:hypothetical protein